MKTVSAEARDGFTIKKSEFIGIIVPVNSMSQAIDRIDQARQHYDGARHVAWAAKVDNRVRMSDDGEPSGTAGMPILNVLQHQGIDQVLLMVVRYFGGIKLGAGGLSRAYSQAATLAVQASQLTEFIPTLHCLIEADYAKESQVRHIIAQFEGDILNTAYADLWSVQVRFNADQMDAVTQALENSLQGRVVIRLQDNAETAESATDSF